MKHLRLASCFWPYEQLMRNVRSQKIGELRNILLIDRCRPVTGVMRATVTAMEDMFLSKRRQQHTLNEWKFHGENCFSFTTGGDGAPCGKDDTDMTSWCVCFLNWSRRVGSPQYSFLPQSPMFSARILTRRCWSMAARLLDQEIQTLTQLETTSHHHLGHELHDQVWDGSVRPKVHGQCQWGAAQLCHTLLLITSLVMSAIPTRIAGVKGSGVCARL